MKKKIMIFGTGGTIACTKTADGLKPDAGVSQLINYVPEIQELCEVEELQLCNVDSTNLLPKNWLLMAANIRKYYDEYDGFLILHGTDTMAYTAAALSYLVQNSKKPIVITGSQFPMEEEHTDAKDNVYQSIRYLIDESACDVSVVFAGKIIPGGRVRKVRSQSLDAFECVGYDFDVEKRNKPISERPLFYGELNEHVLIWKLIPGLKPDTLLKAAEDFDGIIIEGFGLGGLPNISDNDYFPVLKQLTDSGKTVAITTQVPLEGTDMSVYEVGVQYKSGLPVLEGRTMTPEAMAVKMMWVLGNAKEAADISFMFCRSINYDLV